MRSLRHTAILTLIVLLCIDLSVARILTWAERTDRLGALVTYFEYGRSVPGKIARWQDGNIVRGNLLEVAWIDQELIKSAEKFEAEPSDVSPVLRTYGMSFVDNITRAAGQISNEIIVDRHSGPGAPANFTYAFFDADRENRRPGDIAILGILSSSVHAMAALSNRTWAFEQPAPFTYPVYLPAPETNGLIKVDPVISSRAKQAALAEDTALKQEWHNQLATEDNFYSATTFGMTWADRSPFLRLVRRSLAKSHLDRSKTAVIQGDKYPYQTVLSRMVTQFSKTAMAQGLKPVVILVQSGRPSDPDLAKLVRPILEENKIAYLATADHANPRDPSVFAPDGHYKPDVDRQFGEALLEILQMRP